MLRDSDTTVAATQVRIEVENAHEGVDFQVMLSALKMNDLISPLLKGIKKLAETTLSEAGVAPDAIGRVVLVGGGCRIPKVVKVVESIFESAEVCSSLNADEVVVMGAAAQAAALVGCSMVLGDALKREVEVPVTPRDICIGTGDGRETVLLIAARTALPCERSLSMELLDTAQNSALFQIYEGPPGVAQHDKMVAAMLLEGIEAGPVHLSVLVDTSGALTLHAKDASGTARHNLTVSPSA